MRSTALPVLRPLLLRLTRQTPTRLIINQIRCASTEESDPGMNGGYVNPPRIKRSLRDPYGDWWDKQERRNYGEPVHEDNDILGIFSTEVYNHATPAKAWASLGAFILATFGLVYTVKQFYPDRVSAPRTWADGLEAELGGKRALLAPKDGDEI